MSDFPTFPELFAISRAEVLARSKALTTDVVDRAGTDANALTAAPAAVGDALVGQLVQAQAATYLSSAKKEKLDRLVFDRYGILRKPASPALGEAYFTTSVVTGTAFTIPTNTLLSTADGLQYKTTVATTFPAGSTGPVVVPIVSTSAGLDQHATPGTITSIPSPIPGAAATLQVTNPLATVGATDEEPDPALQARASLYYTTAFRGTPAALRRGALEVPGVRTASVYEATDEWLTPARWVQVVVADQFAQQFVKSTGVTPEYQTQAQTLTSQVLANLEEYRAAGIYVQVVVGYVTLVGITLSLRILAGFDHDTVAAGAKAFAQDYVNNLSPGETLVITDLEAAVARTAGLESLGGMVLSPSANMLAGSSQVFRTATSLITIGQCFEVSA